MAWGKEEKKVEAQKEPTATEKDVYVWMANDTANETLESTRYIK